MSELSFYVKNKKNYYRAGSSDTKIGLEETFCSQIFKKKLYNNCYTIYNNST